MRPVDQTAALPDRQEGAGLGGPGGGVEDVNSGIARADDAEITALHTSWLAGWLGPPAAAGAGWLLVSCYAAVEPRRGT